MLKWPATVRLKTLNPNCIITPGLWALIGEVWDYLGLKKK